MTLTDSRFLNAREAEFQENKKAYQSDWKNGAMRAFEDYADAAANAAELSHGVFSNALGGLEDSLVKFAQTGKLSFSDLADSIIADLARVAAKQMVSGLISSIGQMFGPKITGFSIGGSARRVPDKPNQSNQRRAA